MKRAYESICLAQSEIISLHDRIRELSTDYIINSDKYVKPCEKLGTKIIERYEAALEDEAEDR